MLLFWAGGIKDVRRGWSAKLFVIESDID